MALTDLERLTRELAELAELLRAETKSASRLMIMQRVQEIMDSIGEGIRADK